jgi:hypothetical protein
LKAVDQELDSLFRTAIESKRLIQFKYKGSERIAEPHDYGIQNGKVRLLCWQVGGKSKGRLPGWRLADETGSTVARCSTEPLAETERFRTRITDGTKFSFARRRVRDRR